MLSDLKQYLARVKSYSKLEPSDESEIVRELQTHFEDEITELCESGLSPDEATGVATKRFGAAESLGREIYEVYSKGTWSQALLAAAPHLMLAFTFAFHLWKESYWLVGVTLALLGMTIYAWRHGKPSWAYSWLGYFLVPLFAVSFLVVLAMGRFLSQFMLGDSMQWVVIVVYSPVALWLLGYILVYALRRDWLLASFMLLPFPVMIVWLFALEQDVGLAEYSRGAFQGGDQGVALTFLALGITAGAFIRLRQRLLKISVLALATLLILSMVWRFTESGLNPVLAIFISFSLVTFLLSPVLLQGKFAHRDSEVETWDEARLKKAARRT